MKVIELKPKMSVGIVLMRPYHKIKHDPCGWVYSGGYCCPDRCGDCVAKDIYTQMSYNKALAWWKRQETTARPQRREG